MLESEAQRSNIRRLARTVICYAMGLEWTGAGRGVYSLYSIIVVVGPVLLSSKRGY